MVHPYNPKRCTCDATCDCCRGDHTRTHVSTAEYRSDSVAESDKRDVEAKALRLEKKEELNSMQHWKHKNKPRF